MTAPGQHRCARGPRCAAVEVDTDSGQRRGAHTTTPDTLCDCCAERLRRALDTLPQTYVELETILDRAALLREKVAGTADPAAPLRLEILDLQAALDHELSVWAEPVAEVLGVSWDTQVMAAHRPGPRLQRAARLLALNVVLLLRLGPVEQLVWTPAGSLASVRTGVEGALALLDLHGRARLCVTGGTGDAKLPVPCPSCEGVLVRRNGAGRVECQSCPRTWQEPEYARLCVVLAEDFAA